MPPTEEPTPDGQDVLSPSERRLDNISREIFDRAVTQGATQATQNVAAMHRVRLVTQAGIAAFVAAVSVGLVLAFVFRTEAHSTERRQALANCQLIQQLSAPLADFIGTEAALRSGQARLSVTKELLAALRPAQRRALQRLASASLSLNQQAVTHWQTVDVPEIQAIASANCKTRVQ